jgi:hypothetical protein
MDLGLIKLEFLFVTRTHHINLFNFNNSLYILLDPLLLSSHASLAIHLILMNGGTHRQPRV